LWHYATPQFWEAFSALPEQAQRSARKAFALIPRDPHHPSLHMKKTGRFWSVRIDRRHRALAAEVNEGLAWWWIGDHAQCGKLLEGR
jgi:hypothetical protein